MATELAQAYVQILPTTKGIAGQLSSQLGGEAGKAGDSAGKLLGGSLVSKVIAVVAAAQIGKKIVEGISASMREGAALEQSIGGIETLFKNSSDKVIENAKNAFSTAGMSANEYMENVTSFSASLLQGLSGDTEKAADIADMAMKDMSDNSNKMGTAMESIQMAYQGFAKQNYTMLDNLKLGYGGTKTEMERLLADAQAITGVKYDINNLSDVYSAIHVIQGELDITGTTAKEAATTFTGSFSAMQASWSNLLGYIANGEDLTQPIQNLVSTASTFFFGNFLPMLGNIVGALPGAIVTLISEAGPILIENGSKMISSLLQGIQNSLPTMMSSGSSAIDTLLNTITEKLPGVLKKGEEIVSNLANGFFQNIPTFTTQVGNMLTKLISFIGENLPTILESGANILLSIVKGFIKNLPAMVSASAGMLAKIISTIGKYLPNILQKGIEIVGKLIAGLIKSIPDLVAAVPKLTKTILDKFKEVDWLEIGTNVIKGIVKGLKNGISAIADAIKEVAKSAIDAAKSALGIHSPSRVFEAQVGRMIDLGMAAGIDNNMKSVMNSMKALSSETVNFIQPQISTALQGYETGYEIRKTEFDYDKLAEANISAFGESGITINIDGRTAGRLLRRYI